MKTIFETALHQKEQQEHANVCSKWFNDWVLREESDREMFESEMEEYDNDPVEAEEELIEEQEWGDGEYGVSVGDHGSPC